ncbi:tRNA lysidine(34) synthetase TilS [Sagittula sp. S175]|uniref:tRNA lysidine(34) synthetase TilS n=1 Tax=Sagittula sp. S175 TaxID=3415129 RepID=UPI003C7D4400
MSLDRRFAESMGALLGPSFPSEIGLAVSGGGDSMAMLLMAHNWTRDWGVGLRVVTVDHGLRPEAAEEAAMVGEECAALGWPHAVLRWSWDGRGNKMEAAREGRLRQIEGWRGSLRHVLFAHTRDDVAEGFLMRLARGAGVDGLSAMAARRRVHGFDVVRPCLGMGRAELRHYLTVLKGRWVDDPSNDDPSYDRARMRRLLAVLQDEGLGAEVLAGAAGRMGRAREALAMRAADAWEQAGREGANDGVPTGEILFYRGVFERIERDTQLRLLAAALMWVSGNPLRPRIAPLEALMDRLLSGGAGTLHGCEAVAERSEIRVFRELSALGVARGTLWDGRWSCDAHGLRALGEDGWQLLAEENRARHPFRAARSLPSLWEGDRLVACPALGLATRTTGPLEFLPMGTRSLSFRQFLMTH